MRLTRTAERKGIQMKRFITIALTLALSLSLAVPAFAANSVEDAMQSNIDAVSIMNPEEVASEIEAISKEFPEAKLSAAAAMQFANEMSQLSVEEQFS